MNGRARSLLAWNVLAVWMTAALVGCAGMGEPPPPPPPLKIVEQNADNEWKVTFTNVGERKYGGWLDGTLETGLVMAQRYKGAEPASSPVLFLKIRTNALGGQWWYQRPFLLEAGSQRIKEQLQDGDLYAHRGRWWSGWPVASGDLLRVIRAIPESESSQMQLANQYAEGSYATETYTFDARQKEAFGMMLQRYDELNKGWQARIAKGINTEVEKRYKAMKSARSDIRASIRRGKRKHNVLMNACRSGGLMSEAGGLYHFMDAARKDGISSVDYLCAEIIYKLCDVKDAPFRSLSSRTQLGAFFANPQFVNQGLRTQAGLTAMMAMAEAGEKLSALDKKPDKAAIRAEVEAGYEKSQVQGAQEAIKKVEL